ncbi:MAG: 2,5-diamino-6-(ribosylamino)-4(3H)-pyrimidinone 5'-phosphate reductase [Candidatus Helarchaeota archaeon]
MNKVIKTKGRPYVILNAAMSLDGKIATVSGEAEFSSDADWKRVHKLRSEVNAVMVGINTILKDDPKLYVKYYKTAKFMRIIIDSKARTPPNAKLFQMDSETYPVLIAVAGQAPESNIHKLKEKGAQILRTGNAGRVDLQFVMKELLKLKIKKVLLEGGGTLNFSMLQEKLVDEVRVAIAPVIVGGENAITLVEGLGMGRIDEWVRLEFLKYKFLGENIVLFFLVKN